MDARERNIRGEDGREYTRYTGPQRLDKAMHTLEGLLKGVAADDEITAQEVASVRSWMIDNAEYANRHPFNEIIPFLEDVLSDGVVTPEEAKDVLWLCEKLSSKNEFFAAVTCDIQRMQGMLGGIAADGIVTKDELDGLTKWMEQREHLKGVWPYDEIESVITGVLADGKVDEQEHRVLLALFEEFVARGEHKAIDLPLNEMTGPISGFCAVCPEVEFAGKRFCFTGRSERAPRRKLAEFIEQLGGEFVSAVRKGTDYLIIGAEGNSSWAFACYGRKVEQAMEHRKAGRSITLVHEYDFWDAVADAGLDL